MADEELLPPEGGTAAIGYGQLGDPTVREMVRRSFQRQGETGVFSPVDYTPLQEEEMRLAKERLSGLATAERTVALRDIEKAQQKRGLTFSGQTTERQLEASDEIRLREQAEFAGAQENILSRYGGYREAERGRQFGLLSQEIGVETAVETAGMQTTSAEKISRLETAAQERITAVRVAADKEIAQLNADTSLSVADRQVAIAGINNNTAKDIARIQQETAREGMQSQQDIAKWQITADEANLIKSLSAQETIAFRDATEATQRAILQTKSAELIADKQIAADAYKFGITTTEDSKRFWADFARAEKEFEITNDQKWQMFQYQMKQEWQTVNLQNDTDREKFWASLELSKEQFKEDIKHKDKLLNFEKEKFTQGILEWKVGTEQDATEFWATFNEGVKQFGMTIDQQWQIANAKLTQDWQVVNLTNDTEREKFFTQFELAKEQFKEDVKYKNILLTFEQKKFEQGMLEWKVGTEQAATEFWATFNEGVKQFNMTLDQQWQIANKQLSQQWKETNLRNDTERGTFFAQLELAKEQFKSDVKYKDRVLTLEQDKFNESIKQFTITTTADTEKFWATLGLQRDTLEANKIDSKRTYDLAVDQFLKESQQWSIDTTQKTAEFWANFGLAADELSFNKELQTKVYNQSLVEFGEKQRQFNLTTTTQSTQFWANFGESVRALDSQITDNTEKNRLQGELITLQKEAFKENIRQFDLTTTTGTEQFWANYGLAEKQIALDKSFKEAAFAEQIRQFNLNETDQWAQWSAQFVASVNQWQVSRDDQVEFAKKTLEIQRDQLTDASKKDSINQLLGFMNSPTWAAYMASDRTDDQVAIVVTDLFEMLVGETGGEVPPGTTAAPIRTWSDADAAGVPRRFISGKPQAKVNGTWVDLTFD